jgi:hypothetical protein
MFDVELDDFKTKIDLRAYAAAEGYEIDKRDSSRGSTCMRHPGTDDKIFIGLHTKTNHYVYWSVRDEADNGTILDFVARRKGIGLTSREDWAAVTKELREWIGAPPAAIRAFAPLVPTTKDRIAVEAAYAEMPEARRHPYLEQERALPFSLLGSPRFAGRIRTEARNGIQFPNAVFPHFDKHGLCGYEVKNTGFTGFAKGGTKGLWFSRTRRDDSRVVFCESAIDALSYAALFPSDTTRYASIGGKPNPEQPALVLAAIVRMPPNSEIVAAMDADEDGRKLAGVVRQACEFSGRSDLRFEAQEPAGFKDWNEQLVADQRGELIPVRTFQKPCGLTDSRKSTM